MGVEAKKYIFLSSFHKKMAHRKNPSAQRRRRILSNPVFCIYTRKNYTLQSWTNMLKRLQRTKNCTKSRLGVRHLNQKNGGGTRKNTKQKRMSKKKNVLKQTNAVVYSSHYSNTLYPLFSKAISFQPRKIQKKISKKKFSRSTDKFIFFIFPLHFVTNMCSLRFQILEGTAQLRKKMEKKQVNNILEKWQNGYCANLEGWFLIRIVGSSPTFSDLQRR